MICCAPERAAFDKSPIDQEKQPLRREACSEAPAAGRIDFYDGSEAILELPSVEAMTLN